MTIERRAFSFELRADAAIDGAAVREVSGYAALFGAEAELYDGWREVIRPGAFAESLAAADDIYMLWQHESSKPMASRNAKSLTLFEDATGLGFSGKLGASDLEGYWYSQIQGGTIRRMSFGFQVPTGGDIWDHETKMRTITRAKLFEVSPVTWPAYPDTSISARSADFATLLKANPAPAPQVNEGFPLELQLRVRGRLRAKTAREGTFYGSKRKTAGTG